MRITKRTPPVRIAAADMVALAALPAEHAGLLLRWGMRLYGDGDAPTVQEAMQDGRLDARGFAVLVDGVRALLDPRELARGRVAVRCFADAAAARDRVSVSRVRSTVFATEEAVRAAAGSKERRDATAGRRPTAVTPTDAAPTPASPESIPELRDAAPDERDAIAAALVSRGVAEEDAIAATSRWIALHGLRETYDAVAGLADRRIAKAVPYVDRVLENGRSQRTSDMPSAVLMANRGGALPRPVKRRIHVGPRASWEFLGWTARGHGRDGGVRGARREVWRTDAGTLVFQNARPGVEIPDYSEDPGVYDHE